MISVKRFRLDVAAFEDEGIYENSAVQFWLDLAQQMLLTKRWGGSGGPDPWNDAADPQPKRTIYDVGCELYVAHHLVLEKRANDAAEGGGTPGAPLAVVNSKSVDKVRVGYDVQAGIELNAGHWNTTMYGIRFIRLARMAGAGPIQVGAGSDCIGAAGAWDGPIMGPPW